MECYALKNLSRSPKLRKIFFRLRPKSYARNYIDFSAQRTENARRILLPTPPKLQLVNIPYKGRGIICTAWFVKGDYVVNYVGELVSRSEGLKREKRLIKAGSDESFLYFFACNTTRYCLDATPEDGSFGRLVNHSRLRPNCHARAVLVGGKPGIVLVAARDIIPGEEIIYDYGEVSPEKLKALPWLEES